MDQAYTHMDPQGFIGLDASRFNTLKAFTLQGLGLAFQDACFDCFSHTPKKMSNPDLRNSISIVQDLGEYVIVRKLCPQGLCLCALKPVSHAWAFAGRERTGTL